MSENQYERKNTMQSPYEAGKIPPQARDLEESILGSLMLGGELYEVRKILKAEDFYVEANSLIYAAILQLSDVNKPIDILTVTEQLKKDGKLEECGGSTYVSKLTNKYSGSGHEQTWALIVKEKAIKRNLITLSQRTMQEAFEDVTDTFDLLHSVSNEVEQIHSKGKLSSTKDYQTVAAKAYKKIAEAAEQQGDITGIRSGFADIDKRTGGYQPGNLILLAARPGMGKTSLMLCGAYYAAARHGRKVGMISAEMGDVELMWRIFAMNTGADSEKFRNGNLTESEWDALHDFMAEDIPSMYISDEPNADIDNVKAEAHLMKRKYGIEILYVDYVQILRSNAKKIQNRENEIADISGNLKQIARELEIPVYAGCQLSRKVEDRGGDKVPQMSDLRESGALEQDADIVHFLYRPEFYGIVEDEAGESLEGIAKVITAKFRNGRTGTDILAFNSSLTKFSDLDTKGQAEYVDFYNKDDDCPI